jgi:hypothetical protein
MPVADNSASICGLDIPSPADNVLRSCFRGWLNPALTH